MDKGSDWLHATCRSLGKCPHAGVVWIGDLATEHKLAPNWQPLLAWVDELGAALDVTLDLKLDPRAGAALQAAALAAIDTQAGSGGEVGSAGSERLRVGVKAAWTGPGRGGMGPPMGLQGLAERAAGTSGREVVAEILAVFPAMLPATAEQAQGAPDTLPCAAFTTQAELYKGRMSCWPQSSSVGCWLACLCIAPAFVL